MCAFSSQDSLGACVHVQVTPLPNVTVYYTGYRLYSNYRALQVSHQAIEHCSLVFKVHGAADERMASVSFQGVSVKNTA